MVAGLLAGCRPVSAGQEVTFAFFGDLAEQEAYSALADAFEAAHPDIEIELHPAPSQDEYLLRLAAEFAAGAPADIMLINYRRFAAFAAEGALEPVEPYLAQSTIIQAAGFYTPTLAAFTYEGALWCIPQNISSLVVYYNQDMFDAAGVAFPQAGWSRDDFVAAARALTRDLDGDGRIDQYGAGVTPNLFRLAPFIWQEGGELVDDPQRPTRLMLDSPPALRAFHWFVGLQTQEHVVPDAAAEAAESSESRFLNGRLAMYFNSRRGVPTYRTIQTFAWDVAPLPGGPQAAGILHSDAFCLAAASSRKQAAWKFIEYANSHIGQTLLAGSGRTVPSLISVAQSPAFLDPAQPPAHSQVFLDTVPTLRGVPVLATWPAIEETAGVEVERAFYGRVGVEEAAAIAVEQTLPMFARAAGESQ
jgi:multiple sugar transport system substrate-binding protein